MIDAHERDMMNRVMRLGDRTADSLMTPRNRIAWLDTQAGLERNLESWPNTSSPGTRCTATTTWTWSACSN